MGYWVCQPVALLGGAGWQRALCCGGTVCVLLQGYGWWGGGYEAARGGVATGREERHGGMAALSSCVRRCQTVHCVRQGRFLWCARTSTLTWTFVPGPLLPGETPLVAANLAGAVAMVLDRGESH